MDLANVIGTEFFVRLGDGKIHRCRVIGQHPCDQPHLWLAVSLDRPDYPWFTYSTAV